MTSKAVFAYAASLALLLFFKSFLPLLYDVSSIPVFRELSVTEIAYSGFNTGKAVFAVLSAIAFVPCVFALISLVAGKLGFFVKNSPFAFPFLAFPFCWALFWSSNGLLALDYALLLIAFSLVTADDREANLKNAAHVFFTPLFASLSLFALLQLSCSLGMLPASIAPAAFGAAHWLFPALSVVYAVLLRRGVPESLRSRLLLGAQLPLPAVFLYCGGFACVDAGGGRFEPLASVPLVVFYALAFIALEVLNVRAFASSSGRLLPASFASVPAILLYEIPPLQAASYKLDKAVGWDHFHYGEFFLPMEQLLDFGKLPWFGITPIHGLCDYWYAFLNWIFWGGSFASINLAVLTGNLILVSLFCLFLFRYSENKGLVMILMILFLDLSSFDFYNFLLRWILVFAFVFAVNSGLARRNPAVYACHYVLFGIMAVLWAPSIGGAAAMAMLPAVAFNLFRELKGADLRALLKGNLAVVAVTFIASVLFVPVFIEILGGYILDNTGLSVELFSNAMPEIGAVLSEPSSFLRVFGWLIPAAVFAFLRFFPESPKIRVLAGEFLSFTLLSMPFFSLYTLTRYDSGERAVLAVFLYLAFLGCRLSAEYFGLEGASALKRGVTMASVFAVLSLVMSGREPVFARVAPAVPASSAGLVRYDASEFGKNRMGGAFLSPLQRDDMKSTLELIGRLCPSDGAFLNLSGNLAVSGVSMKESMTRYTSYRNIGGKEAQKRVLSELERRRPDLVLVRKFNFPPSLRCFWVYRWLLSNGYRPYRYGTVVFMTPGDCPVEGASPAAGDLESICSNDDLGSLPMIWGASGEGGASPAVDIASSFEVRRIERVSVPSDSGGEAAENRIVVDSVVRFAEPAGWGSFDLLRIDGRFDGAVIKLNFASGASSKMRISGDEKSIREFLVPVSSNPGMLFYGGVSSIELLISCSDEPGFDLCSRISGVSFLRRAD